MGLMLTSVNNKITSQALTSKFSSLVDGMKSIEYHDLAVNANIGHQFVLKKVLKISELHLDQEQW